MNRSLIIGIVAGAIAATAGGAYAGFRTLGDAPSAEVLEVEPLTRTMRVDRQVCADEVASPGAQPCRMVYDIRQEADGFHVRYLLDGQEGVARTDQAPGQTIPVKNGQLDLSALTASE